jgi:SAM-dependent methyltransferase
MAPRPCPGCGSDLCRAFYEVRRAPASSKLVFSSRAEAIALPRGNIELVLCRACGLVFNAAFDPSLTTAPRDPHEDQAFATVKAFKQDLADQLVARFALHQKHILEFGSGGGDFLGLLCSLGGNQGVGIAPGDLPEPVEGPPADRASIALGGDALPDPGTGEPVDLVCVRMVLERVAEPARFVRLMRRAVRPQQGRLFLQVPDLVRTLRQFAFWEIHYEHCSYFSPGTLQRLLDAQGFTVGHMWTELDGQLLMADARAGFDPSAVVYAGELLEPVADLERLVARFALECQQKQALWCEILRGMANAGNRVMVWGTGPGTVSFLTTLAVGDEVGWVVDPDPRRQGKYLPGTGHLIVGPEGVAALRPDVLIITNWIYTLEIQELLHGVGYTPTLLSA